MAAMRDEMTTIVTVCVVVTETEIEEEQEANHQIGNSSGVMTGRLAERTATTGRTRNAAP